MKIILAGSRTFGAAALDLILEHGHQVEVVTSPSQESDALRVRTAELGLRWVSGRDFGPSAFGEDVDLLVAAHSHAFISNDVLWKTRLGGVGYHPSLLPRHRGRDSIRWAVHMGDVVTGGTVYWLCEDVDAGDIAAQDWCWIVPGESASDLWRDKLYPMGLRLLDKVLTDVANDVIISQRQDERLASWEPAWERPPLREREVTGQRRPGEPEVEVRPAFPTAAATAPFVPARPASNGNGGSNGNGAVRPIELDVGDQHPRGRMTWQLLDAILRRYHDFRSLYEAEGIDQIPVNGMTINLHQLLDGIEELPPRQKQAVILACIEDMREVDVAAIMLPGSKSAAPVGSYKRRGLQRLADRWNELLALEETHR